MSASWIAVFFQELRRRRVVRVAIVYAVVSWALVQVAATVGPALNLPDWTDSFVVLMALIGFPLAMILAWAYEVTPEGVRRTEPEPEPRPQPSPAAPLTAPLARSAAPPRRGLPTEPVSSPTHRATRAPVRTDPPGPAELRRAAVATLRHELRTPLGAVIGYSELLLEDLPEDRAEPLRAVLAAGQRNLTLVNEIVRPAVGEDTPDDTSLARMRRRVCEEMGRPAERLVELCREARVALADEPAAAEQDLDRIVEAAGRLLEVVQAEARGAEGGGTGVDAGPTRTLAARVIAGLPRGQAPLADAPPKHGHILVVDDNEDNRLLLSRQLARAGFSVSVAADGAAALAALRDSDFDLVLLDVLMPGLDGIEVLARMHDDPSLAEIPVIMTSAMDEIEGVARCIEQGAVDYLTKPFDPVLLHARIGATLDLHRLRAQQRRARQELDLELAWSDRLVRSLVPGPLTSRVREGLGSVVETHDAVTSLVVVLQGLGTYGMRQGAAALEAWVSGTMVAFEAIAHELPVEMHWETGATMLASTGTIASKPLETDAIAELALRLRDAAVERVAGMEPVRVGIGVHTGTAVCALIDAGRVSFGLWGDAPDTARELAWRCPTGEVRASPAAHAALHDTFIFESRGFLETAAGSQMRAFALVGRRAAGIQR